MKDASSPASLTSRHVATPLPSSDGAAESVTSPVTRPPTASGCTVTSSEPGGVASTSTCTVAAGVGSSSVWAVTV